MAEFQLGSISTGTLRTEDLLPVFTATMRQFLTDNGHKSIYVERAETIIRNDFYDMELADELVGTLMDGIQGYCPPFVYFGTLPGDGADFGFWPDLEAIDESCGLKHHRRTHNPDTGEIVLEDDSVIVQINDHGNVTVMDMARNVLWSVV